MLAKREGFEPPEPFSSLVFGTRSINQTRTPLRMAAADGIEPPPPGSEPGALAIMRCG